MGDASGKKNDVLLGRSHISRPKTCTFESMILRVSPVWSDRIDTVDGKNPAPLRMPHMLFFPPLVSKTFSGIIRSGAGFFPSTVC